MLSCQSQPAGLGVNFSKYFWNCLLEGPSSILSSTYFIAITGQFAHFKYTRIQAVKELVLLGRSVRFRIIRLASLTPIKNLYSSVIIAKWITEWKESPNTSGRLVRWHQLLISAQFSKDEKYEKKFYLCQLNPSSALLFAWPCVIAGATSAESIMTLEVDFDGDFVWI